MAETSYLFDGTASEVREATWIKLAPAFLADGVYLGQLNSLMVYGDSSGMQVKVPTGRAACGTHFYENDAELIKSIAANASGNPRIDRVILRADRTANTVRAEILQGTPGVIPEAPALTQSSATYEISLAQVAVANAAATITAANVTDERPVSMGFDGSTGGIVKIAADVTLAAPAALIEFANIPQTFRHLRLMFQGRTARAVAVSGFYLSFNNAGAGSYDSQISVAAGASAAAVTNTRISNSNGAYLIDIPGTTTAADVWGSAVIDIPRYAAPSGPRRTLFTTGGSPTNDAGQLTNAIGSAGGVTTPINRIKLFEDISSNLIAGTSASLYGIR